MTYKQIPLLDVGIIENYGHPFEQRSLWRRSRRHQIGDDITRIVRDVLRHNGYLGTSQNHPEEIVNGYVIIHRPWTGRTTYNNYGYFIQEVELYNKDNTIHIVYTAYE